MSDVSITGRAVDFANYTPVPTMTQIQCWKDLGFDLALVGASFQRYWDGMQWQTMWPRRQLQALQAAGMKRHAFSWLRHPFVQNRDLMETAFEQIAGTGVDMMWVDVEDASAQYVSIQQRVNDVWLALDYWKNARPDLPVGIYTGDWWWDQYMPGVTETFGVPLWMAAYVLEEEDIAGKTGISEAIIEHYIPGGWKPEDVWLWQYMGSIETCNLNTDRNLILEAGRMKYTDEVLDKTFGAILKDLGQKGQLIAALGTGLGSVAKDLYTHIYNNGDFTRPQMEQLTRIEAEIASCNERTQKLVDDIMAAGAAFNAER